jgi:hypothetical protein
MVSRLRARRGRGESYTEVILRLVEQEGLNRSGFAGGHFV